MSTLEKVKGFIVKPTETFLAYKDESLGKAYQYYVILLIIFSVLYGIVSIATGLNSFSEAVSIAGNSMGPQFGEALSAFSGFATTMNIFIIYLMFVLSLFTIFLSGFMIHCFVLLFGGEKGYRMTFKSVFYASTPALLLGWIPFVNIIASIWYLILQIIGIKAYHEISTGKAVAVVLVPIILIIIGIVLFGAVIATFLSGMMSAAGMHPW
ncbi:hypothetical protein J2128_002392 [Methanomicrobium sp. W14]|uniref:YIP1 family protein n=1 Tax=Methanomicrobium sp. W14 TaxID=2817839 RepID=UPI001AE4FE69|nr:YIP1 family protein [Methanomicrobium sp. W14]MBP2134426.1 hypothetical protein [Methanomicrobium sp. W14]